MSIVKRKTVIIGFLLFVLIFSWVVGLGCWPFLQWSPLNRRHEDVDIDSGRIRRQWELLGICVQETIEESAVSRELADEIAGQPENWQRVNTFSPLVHYSPHYKYHAAIYQISCLELNWKIVPFTDEAKRKSSRDLLKIWQFDKGYFPAVGYLIKIEELSAKHGKDSPVSVEDLPESETFREKN